METLDPNWLAGFTSAEGCFMVNTFKSKSSKMGVAVCLVFAITQHKRDELLIKNLIEYFNCGNFFVNKNRDVSYFRVYKFSDITDKIIPFFKKYPIIGVKALDFADWCKVAELMKEKKHLTTAGLKQIKKIKAEMNKGIKN